ncbi:MAG: hypothetical protein ACR2HR_10235 [Euzebya sp.]
MDQPEHVTLGNAAVVTYVISSGGVRIEHLHVAPGWTVMRQVPAKPRHRRRPASTVSVILSMDQSPGVLQWEFEVNQRDDGTWELATNEQWPGGDEVVIDTPAGRLRATCRDQRLSAPEVVVRPGWQITSQSHDDEEILVIMADGQQDWECVIWADDLGHGPTTVQREHR